MKVIRPQNLQSFICLLSTKDTDFLQTSHLLLLSKDVNRIYEKIYNQKESKLVSDTE